MPQGALDTRELKGARSLLSHNPIGIVHCFEDFGQPKFAEGSLCNACR